MTDHVSKSKSAGGASSASATMKKPMMGKFRMITIKPTDNGGAIVEHHMPHDENQKGDKGEYRYVPAPDPSTTGFTTSAEAHAHVGMLMGVKATGKNAGADSSAKEDKSASAKSGKESAADKNGEGENVEDDDESED